MTPRQNRISELDVQITAVRAEMLDLEKIEADTLTDDNKARMEAIPTEFDTLTAERDALVTAEQAAERVRKAAEAPSNREWSVPAVHVQRDAFEDIENVRVLTDSNGRTRMGSDEVIERAMRAFEGKHRRVSEDQLEALMERIETIPGAAEHALVHGAPAYVRGFQEFMRSQGQNPMYDAEVQGAIRASLSLTGANGGYTLPTLLDPTLIHTGAATKNPIRAISRVESGTQNVWHGVGVGNVTTYWVAENTALTDGTPTFSSPSVTAAKLTAYVTGSYELFEDSASVAQLPGLIAEAMDFTESAAFVSGSGSGAPKGIITAVSGTAGSTVTATTRGSFTTASAVDVFALVNALPSRYEDSATWVANKATFNTIKQMSTGSQGSYFWSDFNNGVPEGQGLLGSPVRKSSTFSSATTSGTKLIVLGDFSQFIIYDRIGTQVEYIQNVVDGSGLPTGTRGLVAHKRVGSDITDVDAFRIFNT